MGVKFLKLLLVMFDVNSILPSKAALKKNQFK